MAREVCCSPCVTGRVGEGGRTPNRPRPGDWTPQSLASAGPAPYHCDEGDVMRAHKNAAAEAREMSAGPRLIAAPAPIATPSCSGTRCALRLAQTGPEEVSVRRNSWPRSRPHWCVRDCDAVSQQDLDEETGCGQADCSIMPGTCKLHDPACHCALAFLLGAALPSAGGNAQKCAKKTHKCQVP